MDVSQRFGDLRAHLKRLITHPRFEPFIIGLIVFNAILLGMETSPTVMAYAGEIILAVDTIILWIFVFEIAARMLVHGAAFWREPWNIFDFVIVAITLIPASGNMSVLRALRILRALRLVSAIPSVRRVVGSLLSAVPAMSSVLILLMLLLYVFSVMGTKLYGKDFPEFFGTIGASAYTLFQIMTLEGWSGEIVRPVMAKHPSAWMFFVPFIIFSAFFVLNLFIGIVVDAMQQQSDDKRDQLFEETESELQQVLSEVRALRAQVATLQAPQTTVGGGGGGGTSGADLADRAEAATIIEPSRKPPKD
ncbi:MAG: ion transporter [Pseudomonadota bacterium]